MAKSLSNKLFKCTFSLFLLLVSLVLSGMLMVKLHADPIPGKKSGSVQVKMKSSPKKNTPQQKAGQNASKELLKDNGKKGDADILVDDKAKYLKKDDAPGKTDSDKKDIRDQVPDKEPQKAETEKKEDGSSKVAADDKLKIKQPHYILLFPGKDTPDLVWKNWSNVFNRQEISDLVKNKNLVLKDKTDQDDGDAACFVTQFGSSVKISGLKRDRTYSIWINFVRFGNYNKNKYPTELKIYIKNSDSGKAFLQAVNYGQIAGKSLPRKIEIPYKYTIKGSLELIFVELAPIKGFWGIWDMLIADRYTDRADAMKESKASGGAGNQDMLKSDDKDHILEAK